MSFVHNPEHVFTINHVYAPVSLCFKYTGKLEKKGKKNISLRFSPFLAPSSINLG